MTPVVFRTASKFLASESRRFAIALAVLPIFLTACREAPPAEKPPTPVRIETAELFTPQTGRRYSASIVPYRQVTLAFRSGGFVDFIQEVRGADGRMRSLGPGDPVRQGDILSRVRIQDYDLKVSQSQGQLAEARQSEAAARAQLTQAEAGAKKTALDFDRATKLFATQSVTKPDYDNARAQNDIAQAQVAAAKAQLDTFGARIQQAQANLGEAGISRSDTELIAPFSGYVVQRQVEIGSLTAAGTPAFVIADLDPVKAIFGLPDLEIESMRLGRTLAVTADAVPGRLFTGIVTAVSPVADTSTRLFPAEVSIQNPGKVLLAGMIVSAEPGAVKRDPVLVVPLGAVVRSKQAGRFAVMVVEGSRARLREVSLGDTFGNRMQIMRGLREGERIVVSGAALLGDGDAVRVIP